VGTILIFEQKNTVCLARHGDVFMKNNENKEVINYEIIKG